MLRATLLLSFTVGSAGAVVCAQEPEVLALASEPHHHLALHNEYVNVYRVEVQPGDAVRLHRHDTDAISLSLSDTLVTVHFPGKPDVQQKLKNGQIRLQARGWVHSTSVQGQTAFRNVTVDLLQPQTGERNGCAEVMAKQPRHCEGPQPRGDLGSPQFETDQTFVGLLLVRPHERVAIGGPGSATLIVALDAGAVRSDDKNKPGGLQAGDLVWLDKSKPGATFRNESGADVRLVCFGF
jgi:hypothetical protein